MQLLENLRKLATDQPLANSELPVDIERHGEAVLQTLLTVGSLSKVINIDSLDVSLKDDNSVLTNVDLFISEYVTSELERLTGFPVVSEESISDFPYEKRLELESYWLVDPLDGTRGYAQKSSSYCHMVSFIHKRQSVFAAILLPRYNNAFVIGGLNQGVYTGRLVPSYFLTKGEVREQLYQPEYATLANKNMKLTLDFIKIEGELTALSKLAPASSKESSYWQIDEVNQYLRQPNIFNLGLGPEFMLEFYRNNLGLNFNSYLELQPDQSFRLRFMHGEADLQSFLKYQGLEFYEQARTLVAQLKIAGIDKLSQSDATEVDRDQLLASLEADIAELPQAERERFDDMVSKFKAVLSVDEVEKYLSEDQRQELAPHREQLLALTATLNREAQAAIEMAQAVAQLKVADVHDEQFNLQDKPLALTVGLSSRTLQENEVPLYHQNFTTEAMHSAGVKTYEMLTRDNLVYFLPTCMSEWDLAPAACFLKELGGYIFDIGSGCYLGDKIFTKPELEVLPFAMVMRKELLAYFFKFVKLSEVYFEEVTKELTKHKNRQAPSFKDFYEHLELRLN